MANPLDPRNRGPLIPVIRLDGVIDSGGRFGRGLNLHDLAEVIDHAFDIKKAPAVAIVINSPGGSPVQSALIYKRLRQLSEEKKKPIIAFAEDVAASGGYMLAIAGDEIYVDESSLIGSIGVISASFGFQGAIEKLGVERRVYTAGTNKSSLDPFLPEDEDDIEKLKAIQTEVHAHFRNMVKARRGDKLTEDEDTLMNGDVWAGEKAVALGLVDGIGDMYSVLKKKFGANVRVRTIETRKGFLQQRLGLDMGALVPQALVQSWGRAPIATEGGRIVPQMGEAIADGLLTVLERRGLWGRFGR